jgi:hypothetical protein
MSVCLPLLQQKKRAAETTEMAQPPEGVCGDYCFTRLVFDLLEDCRE